MFAFLRRRRAQQLLAKGDPRRVRVHSIAFHPPESTSPQYVRVAFEFLDPPGPWTMQFYEAAGDQPDVLTDLAPDAKATFFESDDGARTRVLRTESGKVLWPR